MKRTNKKAYNFGAGQKKSVVHGYYHNALVNEVNETSEKCDRMDVNLVYLYLCQVLPEKEYKEMDAFYMTEPTSHVFHTFVKTHYGKWLGGLGSYLKNNVHFVMG